MANVSLFRDVSSKVWQALAAVPREKFIPPIERQWAWANEPIPIGWGQTTSQPALIAKMIELLDLQLGDKVLEVGTGCGYQTAVLLELGNVEVFSVEIIPELAEEAAARLVELGYTRTHLKQGDGYFGWAEHAPFDAILVSAAPDHLPQPLAEQLAEGGRLVLPIGPSRDAQTLWKFVNQDGKLCGRPIEGVMFVPLIHGE